MIPNTHSSSHTFEHIEWKLSYIPFSYSSTRIILLPQVRFGGGQLPAAQFVLPAYMLVRTGGRCMPAGQQGWARCGVGAVGRLGTVGLLIREG